MQNKNSLNYERVKSKSKLEQKRKANVNRMVDKTNEQVYYITFSRVCKLLNTKTHLINKWASGLEVFSGNIHLYLLYLINQQMYTVK